MKEGVVGGKQEMSEEEVRVGFDAKAFGEMMLGRMDRYYGRSIVEMLKDAEGTRTPATEDGLKEV